MDVSEEPDLPPQGDEDPARDAPMRERERDPMEEEDLHAVLTADLARKARQAALDPGNDLGMS